MFCIQRLDLKKKGINLTNEVKDNENYIRKDLDHNMRWRDSIQPNDSSSTSSIQPKQNIQGN